MSGFGKDELDDLELPDMEIPGDEVFDLDDADSEVVLGDAETNVDDLSQFDDVDSSGVDKDKDTNVQGLAQKIAILAATVIALLFFIWPSSDEPTSSNEDISPREALDTPLGADAIKQVETIDTQRVKTVMGPNTNFKRAYTLETINESDNIIELIQQMKVDLDNLRNQNSGRAESLQSLQNAQNTVYHSLAELSRITSSYEVPLDDGGRVIPSGSGFGYRLISGAGIESKASAGVFMMIRNGYFITNKKDLSMIFIIRADDEDAKISHIYKITPTHGLVDMSDDMATKKQMIKLISPQNHTKGVKVEEMKNILMFFNSKGQLAARKKYKSVLKESKKYAQIVKGSARRVVGFETSDFVLYNLSESLIKIDGSLSKIDGISHGLKARYVEYQGSIEEESMKVVEIMNESQIIRRFIISNIETVLLQSANIGKDKYLSKGGLIYKIDVDRQKLLQGSGSILAQVKDGQIVGEKIILNSTRVKYSNLSSLIGMTLQGKSGKQYKVKVDHVEILPQKEIRLFDYFLISSKSELLSKSKIFIDKITEIRSSGKVGGRIVTKNSIIEVRKANEVTIISKLDKKTKVYSDPKVYFDNKHIVIKTKPQYSLDREEKKVGGKEYVSEEVVNQDNSRFIMSNGKYFNDSDPVIRVTETEILREKVIDIESISGSVFDYVYYVDEETGKISASSIGEFKINHESARFDVFNDADDKRTIAQIKAINKKKDVMSFSELITKNDYFSKVNFVTAGGDTIKINSPTSIIYNGVNLEIKNGKYNNKVQLLIISLSDGMSSKDRRRLSISNSAKRIERSVDSIHYINDSYYADGVVVLKLNATTTVIRKSNEKGLSTWTKVYSSRADLFTKDVSLTIKPINETHETTEMVTIGLDEIKDMAPSMRVDMIDVYNKYITSTKQAGTKKTEDEQKMQDNRAILTAKLLAIQASINAMLTKGLVINTHKMVSSDVEKYKELAAKDRAFVFEVGTELTYTIDKSTEISEGEELYVHTDLEQTYFEDREGNTLDMQNPVLILRVIGDFNKSQIIFSPYQIVYTNDKGIRNTVSIPEGSTTLEYKEEDSDYTISGVPAYYVNQKIRELPTTVMLSTLQGVVDSMTAEDPLSSGLDGLQGLVGGDDTTTESAFTDGVASGASSGIQEILSVYKAKAGGKRDMLIASGDIDLKSSFIMTTPLSVSDGTASGE